MRNAVRTACRLVSVALLLIGSSIQPARAQSGISDDVVRSRVVAAVDDGKLVQLAGDKHPMARAEFDRGPVESARMLQKMVLVLQRSPEQEKALAAFNQRQYDPKSQDFHHWLHAEEFGQLYGPSDADLAAVTTWLHSQGFSIDLVSKGRVSIQFTGTVGQVQNAFHLQMHNYLVNGVEHISNDRDPSIPEALAPVVKGIASLNNFFPKHQSHPGNYVKRDLKTGKYTLLDKQPVTGTLKTETASLNSLGGKDPKGGLQPEFGYTDPDTGNLREELSPYDVATIYNVLPLWNESTPINGKGVKVAIVGLSDVETSDFNTFRSSFGLPAGTLTTVHSGSDPGYNDSQGENTEDTEMVSSTAPGAQVVLVADVDNATTNGLVTAVTYIVDNEVAPILTMSYGECELDLGASQNTLFNNTFQQAATAGISSFVAAGDSGSAVCTSQNGTPPYADSYGLAVSGMASTPYVTAVGGTDLQWPLVEKTHPPSTYWNSTNDAHGASAKGYMPEMSWNDTCSNPLLLNVFVDGSGNPFPSPEALCNAAIDGDPGLVEMGSGSGGVSACTTSTGNTPASCTGGWPKPTWQSGVTGIPSDGKRDLPDVSMFAAYGFQSSTGIPGSALLICQASSSPENSCDYSNPDYIIYQENGGTSAASPLTAGIMALVIQKTGSSQGLANPVFYQLAAKENYGSCNSNSVAAGNACIFYDTTTGSNAAVCLTGDTNCVTNTSGDQAGILSGYSATTGYDRTTGLGSFNVANLVNAWPTATSTASVSVSPTSFTFPSTTVKATSTTKATITVKNTGTSAITVTPTSFAFSGADAGSYGASTNCSTSLAAGASCTVTIGFTPVTTGTLTATFTVVDSVGKQTVALSGTGAAAAVTPTVTLTPASLAFAATKVGTATAAQVVTLKNTSTAAATISSIAITGTNATSFLKSATTCGTSLAAAASCTISVEFKPAAAGALTGALTITDNATGSPQSVKLTGTGTAVTPTLSLSAASLTFAATKVGTATAAQVVTLKNTSTAAATISSIAITGTNATSFLKSATTCGTSLAAAASCTISVEFKPAAAGALTGALTITDNATGSPQSVKLTGTGTAVTPTLSLSAASLAFAATKVGTATAAQVVTLKNTSTTAATISSIAITGTNATSFLKSATTCGTSLAAAASCTISVEFKPAAAGALTGALTITDNATGSPQSVKLTGTGTAVTPTLSLSATSLAFAATKVGTATAAQVVTLKNTSTAAATISSIAITGTNATSFLKSATTCGTSLAAAASCTISVEFKPAAAGALTGALTITDNATGSPQSVKLTGTGTAVTPTLSLSAASLTFAATKVGTATAAQVVTLKNTSTAAATISSIAITGTNATSFLKSATTCGTSLAAAASCTISVEFKPAAAGALTGALTITDNATGSPQSVKLTGTGTAVTPTLSLSAASLTFAATKVGTATAAQVVTLKNTSTAAATISSIAITGTNATSFLKSATTCGTSLAAAASCTISLESKPAAVGALTGALTITDNATGSPQSVKLTGSGTTTVSVSATTLNFVTTKKGIASAAQVVTFKNTGTGATAVSAIAITGTNASSFLKSATSCGTSLNAGASCTVSVEFKPAATGALTGDLSFTDNAIGSPQLVKLNGTGD